MKVLFAGAGAFGLPSLRAILETHDVVQVVSQPDRPAGRGRTLTPTPIARFALERGLPLIRTGNINAETLPRADVMVVIAFGQKIASHLVDHPRLGSINLHSSLLPKYRGAAPINAAIVNGDSISGNSVIRLASKMDAGAILGQVELPVGETETAGELHDRLANAGAPLTLRVIDELDRGIAVEREQDHSQSTIAPKLSRESTRIDWTRDARSIASQIRGLYPWPGCRAQISDEESSNRLTLVRVKAVEGVAAASGVIDSAGRVGTSAGLIEVLEVQPEGKRPMPLDAYRNGHPWHAGMRLVSIV